MLNLQKLTHYSPLVTHPFPTMASSLLNNRYRIIQAVGSGGFGTTSMAEDTHMPSSRRCAIKQLKPIAHDPQTYQFVQERFQREAAILEKLGEGSTQIPRLYAYFNEGDLFYLVQEWVEGATLTQQVELRGCLDEAKTISLMLSLLPVLDYLHGEGIIHRDLKPDNLILRRQDEVPVLIDFGAIKETMGTAVGSQGQVANTVIVGTPGYMPPEQAAGRPTYSSDLYSLGLTAIYALTGKSPQQLATDPHTGDVLWRQQCPHLSPALADVLDRAICARARDRYGSAREMQAALQAIAPAGSTPPPAPAPTPTASTVAAAPPSPSTFPTLAVAPGHAGTPTPTVNPASGATVAVTSPDQSPKRTAPWPIFLGVVLAAIAIGATAALLPRLFPASNPVQEAKTTPSADSTALPKPEAPNETVDDRAEDAASEDPEDPANSDSANANNPAANDTASNAGQSDTSSAKVPATQTAANSTNGFPVGTTEAKVKAQLGEPSSKSSGLWRTRAYIYRQGDRTLGLLFDRTSRRLRQTEASFDSAVDVQVMEQTLANMLNGQVPPEAVAALQQIHQRQADEYRFSQGGLKGTIVRNNCDRIYIGIWDASLHGFLDAKGC